MLLLGLAIAIILVAVSYRVFYPKVNTSSDKKDTRQFLVEKDPITSVQEKPAKKPRKPRTKKAKPE